MLSGTQAISTTTLLVLWNHRSSAGCLRSLRLAKLIDLMRKKKNKDCETWTITSVNNLHSSLLLQGKAKMQASLPFLFLMTNLPMQTNSILHLTGGTFFLFPVLLGCTCHSSSPGMLLLKYLKSREIVLLLLDTYVYSPHLVIFCSSPSTRYSSHSH